MADGHMRTAVRQITLELDEEIERAKEINRHVRWAKRRRRIFGRHQ